MEQTAQNQTIDTFIAEIIQLARSNNLKLPTLPEVATKVRKAIDSEDVGADQIAKIISTDAALSARLLQVANSPVYRGSTQIDSVKIAVARLGNKVVRTMAISLVMQQLFQTKYPQLKKRMEQLWDHGTRVAAISSVLAKKFTKLPPDEALLAGLIHDVGALPIINQAESYPVVANSDHLLDDAITRLHCPIGRLVLEAWKLPPELVAVASEHEKLDRQIEKPDLVDVVTVANLHSYIGIDSERLANINFTELPAMQRLGMDADAAIAMMEEAKTEIAEMQGVLK
ncbi:MAG: HDOD domain-containing protein [Gammaproteobacteria bacterium]|nr:HDOD domain-containing protein [Gammaproteobacteria bacterium]